MCLLIYPSLSLLSISRCSELLYVTVLSLQPQAFLADVKLFSTTSSCSFTLAVRGKFLHQTEWGTLKPVCFWRGFCDALSLLSIAVLKVECFLSLTRLPSLAVAVKWKFHCGPITFRLFFHITHLTLNFRR